MSASTSAVVPNWNGAHWLPACLGSLLSQTLPFGEVIVVDNGSRDGSLELLRRDHPSVKVLPLPENTGFAHAANRGLDAAAGELVALVNTDVELAPDWHARTAAAIGEAAAVACKMVSPDGTLYDAGDVLRRDGVCEQRGRFEPDDGRFDAPADVFAACAGAALYRRDAVRAVGGFDERFFAYIEDVDLGLRLRLAGHRCVYEPAVAVHAGGGSSWQLERPVGAWVERNTIALVAKAFPVSWLPLVAYRQAGWAWHAARERRLGAHLAGLWAGLRLLPAMLPDRRRLRRDAVVPIEEVVPPRPIRRAR